MSWTPWRRSLKIATLRLPKRKAVGRRHDAAPTAVDQPNAERVLQFHHRLGNGGLGYAEAARRLAHAAGLDDRHQNIQVAQLEAALGAVVPGHEIPVIPNRL